MENSLVSVVVPAYNMGEKICTCIDSILNQDYKNIEIIIINDGSTDNTKQICQKYEQADNRVVLINTTNQGAGPARNVGIKNCKGKYIYFPDADDDIVMNAISKMVSAMEIADVDLVVFGYRIVNEKGEIVNLKEYTEHTNDGKIIRLNYADYYMMGSKFGIQGAPWNKFFSAKVIRENGIFFPNLKRHQDECFIAKYMNYAKKVHFISEVLYTYYSNSRLKEYEKFPVDYFDIVMDLHKDRKNNIYAWNPKDEKTHNIANIEFLMGIIRALELSFFFKKNHGGRIQHRSWLIDRIKESGIEEIIITDVKGRYNNMLYNSFYRRKYLRSYCLLFIGSTLKKYNFVKAN